MDASATTVEPCAGCGSTFAPGTLACPSCARLVHGAQLERLARDADAATREGRHRDAIVAWRGALELLPQNSVQFARIERRVADLGRTLDAPPRTDADAKGSRVRWLAVAGAVVVSLLSKGKLIVLGFTKLGTLLTMLATVGVYWTAFGWKFAAGLVLSIYVHEMGHVAWLRRYGVAATAPMFIPGVGAFVRLKQSPADAREDARIGLAGPTWGLGAALAFLAVGHFADWPSCVAVACAGAWINLFNLIPVWQLDGSRGFRALSRGQRWLATAAVVAACFWSSDGILILIAIAAFARAFGKNAPVEGDRFALVQYAGLVVSLAIVATVQPET